MKLFVGNFSFSTTEADLQSLFAPYGNIESVTVVTDRQTGRSRGFGFVEMSDRGEAEKAIEALNGKEFEVRRAVEAPRPLAVEVPPAEIMVAPGNFATATRLEGK